MNVRCGSCLQLRATAGFGSAAVSAPPNSFRCRPVRIVVPPPRRALGVLARIISPD